MYVVLQGIGSHMYKGIDQFPLGSSDPGYEVPKLENISGKKGPLK